MPTGKEKLFTIVGEERGESLVCSSHEYSHPALPYNTFLLTSPSVIVKQFHFIQRSSQVRKEEGTRGKNGEAFLQLFSPHNTLPPSEMLQGCQADFTLNIFSTIRNEKEKELTFGWLSLYVIL